MITEVNLMIHLAHDMFLQACLNSNISNDVSVNTTRGILAGPPQKCVNQGHSGYNREATKQIKAIFCPISLPPSN